MRIVVQRVDSVKVVVVDEIVGEISKGLFVLFGAGRDDTKEDAKYLSEKLYKLRIMADENGKMNLSITDTQSAILVVSQFTLYADTKDGNRPSFIKAMNPKVAEGLYHHFVELLKKKNINVQTGKFGEYMKISVELDGPVTIVMDSEDRK